MVTISENIARTVRFTAPPDTTKARDIKVLVLSASALTDRMFFYTDFLDTLSMRSTPSVWAKSAASPYYRRLWQTRRVDVQAYPKIYPFKEFPYNFLRRVNEYNWDFRRGNSSRRSMIRLAKGKSMRPLLRTAKYVGRMAALFPLEQAMEDRLEKFLLAYDRSPEATLRLRENFPDVVISSGPFQYSEPAIIAAAKRLGIPTLALIPSWDNLSTKNRLVMKYDGYIVWSEWQRSELRQFYPACSDAPCYVVGAPQFDVFFQSRFKLTRNEFCRSQGLDPDRQIILYAIGSPNLHPAEKYGALYLAKIIEQGALGDVQMIIRPHPLHDMPDLKDFFKGLSSRIVLQQSAGEGMSAVRSLDDNQVVEWVNSFRHSDVHINTFSTTAIDAAICDTPIINLDYDTSPDQRQAELVQAINHEWIHYKPIAESGGVWLVKDNEALIEAVKTYLRRPELHRERRRSIAEHVCQYLDGRGGERFAQAILDFVETRAEKR